MSAREDEEVVTHWLRYAAEQRKDDFWAWDRLTSLVLHQPEEAWPILLSLIAAAPEGQLGYIGAGPLENLLSMHPAAFGQRIEEQARRDRRFREALASVWLSENEVSSALVARLQRLTGGCIRVMP